MRSLWRFSPIAIAVVVAALALAPGPGLHASAGAGHASYNLSSVQGVDQYLTSIGINPSRAIHQTGARNYAGPNCPGAGWNCTSSKNAVVVQQASAAGVNVFQCTPASGGTNPATDTCVVVQTAPSSGDNNATCKETATDTAPSPSCSITQTNTTGQNVARVDQQWSQSLGDAQTAGERATVTQQNTSGKNDADVEQGIAQKIKDGATNQDQEATQFACVQQDSPSGTNRGQIRQQVTQNEQATATPVSQFQNQNTGSTNTCGNQTTAFAPNLAALIQQDQGSASDSGLNSSNVQQSLHQKQLSSKSTGTVYQQQGNNFDAGGLEGDLEQTSSGLAGGTADQNESQLQDAETNGSLSQIQNDPARCCSNQASNPSDQLKLTQEVVQNADANASQFFDVQGSCVSSGSCNVQQTITSNSGTTSGSCTTSPCFVFNSNEGGSSFAAPARRP